MNRRSPPCWNVKTTWVWGAMATRPVPRKNLPLMPKCATSTSPESSVSIRYLPRRSILATLRPVRREVNSFRVL